MGRRGSIDKKAICPSGLHHMQFLALLLIKGLALGVWDLQRQDVWHLPYLPPLHASLLPIWPPPPVSLGARDGCVGVCTVSVGAFLDTCREDAHD